MGHSVDANECVCLRCQTIVSPVPAPTRQRRNIWWSRRGGVGIGGAGYYTPGKYVCGYCGSGGLVPAGTPRGGKILAEQGISVTGNLRRNRRGLGRLMWGFIFLAAIVLIGVCSQSSNAPAPARNNPKVVLPPQNTVAKTNSAPDKIQSAILKNNQEAADRGDAYGLLRMGERYRDGEGVEKDLEKARTYLHQAALKGSDTAQRELTALLK